MSKVVAIEHVTLDGVMQGPGRRDEDRRDGFELGGWGAAHGDPMIQQAMATRMGEAWSLLLGRTTYEDFAGFWPNQPQPNPFTDVLNAVQKFVASTTLVEPLPWQNSTLLPGDAADGVARLKQERAGNLVIFGSGVLVLSLLRRGLLDELMLLVHPRVLGKGRRLFPGGSPPAQLTLLDSASTATGVLTATYRTGAS